MYIYIHTHQSVTTLELQTTDVSNIDNFVTMLCNAGKPSALESIWMILDMHHPPKHHWGWSTPLHGTGAPVWQWQPTAGQCTLAHHKNCLGMAWGTQQRAQSVDPASRFPRSRSWPTTPTHETQRTYYKCPKPDTTGHPQRSYGNALTGRSCLAAC